MSERVSDCESGGCVGMILTPGNSSSNDLASLYEVFHHSVTSSSILALSSSLKSPLSQSLLEL